MAQNDAFSGDFVKMDGSHSEVYERSYKCLKINIAPELADRLERAAAADGITLTEWLRQAVVHHLGEIVPKQQRNSSPLNLGEKGVRQSDLH